MAHGHEVQPVAHDPVARCGASIADLASASGTSSHGFLRAQEAGHRRFEGCAVAEVHLCSPSDGNAN